MSFVSLKGDCKGLSESTLVKMPHCWKLRVAAQIYLEVPDRVVRVQDSILWRTMIVNTF